MENNQIVSIIVSALSVVCFVIGLRGWKLKKFAIGMAKVYKWNIDQAGCLLSMKDCICGYIAWIRFPLYAIGLWFCWWIAICFIWFVWFIQVRSRERFYNKKRRRIALARVAQGNVSLTMKIVAIGGRPTAMYLKVIGDIEDYILTETMDEKCKIETL